MTNLNIGDKVEILSDAINYNGISVVDGYCKSAIGKIGSITKIVDGDYIVSNLGEECGRCWRYNPNQLRKVEDNEDNKERMTKKILDACCGSRMFWFNRQHPDAIYIDKRKLRDTLCDGRSLEINPDFQADFRCLPFSDNSFYLVVFDPPHLIKAGDKSWLAKKYGRLNTTWQDDIKKGFLECMRVLKPNATLILKWNEEQIKLSELLKVLPSSPLFGNKRAKTHWLVFMKD